MNTQISSALSTATRRVDAELERLRATKVREEKLVTELQQHNQAIADAEEALALAQTTAEETQRELTLELTGLANEAVQCLFPKYTFEAQAVHRAGRLEVEFSLVDQDGARFSPLLSNGGGVVDLLAFALRVVGVKLTGAAGLVILDEPFHFINTPELRVKAAELVRQLCDELGTQFLVVSQDQNRELIGVADVAIDF